jgi:hypothetical protein
MPSVSSQKKIRDLERLKKKLGEDADPEKVEQIDAKIEALKQQKDENIQNVAKVQARNKSKRILKNPKGEKKEKTPTGPANTTKGAFGNSMKKTEGADGNATPAPKATKKRTATEAVDTDGANAKPTTTDHKANMKKITGGDTKPAADAFDPFFIDPKASNLVNNEGGEFHHKKMKKGEELHVSVESLKRYSENGKYFHNHSMAKHNEFMNHKMDTSKMTKQELRLYQWQMKEREKRLTRTAGLFGGMSAAQLSDSGDGNAPKEDNRSARRQNAQTGADNRSHSAGDVRGARSQAPRPSSMSSGGARAGVGARPNAKTGSSRTAAVPIAVPGEKTSATWMQGAGVSAAAITEGVKNKAKGVIVAAQGKKITFD